jgi:hypothetical protein
MSGGDVNGYRLRKGPGDALRAPAGGDAQGATPVRRGHLTALRNAARLAGWFESRNSGFSEADW